MTGAAVSVRVDGRVALGHAFGTSVTDGAIGLLLLDACASALREIALV